MSTPATTDLFRSGMRFPMEAVGRRALGARRRDAGGDGSARAGGGRPMNPGQPARTGCSASSATKPGKTCPSGRSPGATMSAAAWPARHLTNLPGHRATSRKPGRRAYAARRPRRQTPLAPGRGHLPGRQSPVSRAGCRRRARHRSRMRHSRPRRSGRIRVPAGGAGPTAPRTAAGAGQRSRLARRAR